jgi:alpha-1,6-mannosyltransferase
VRHAGRRLLDPQEAAMIAWRHRWDRVFAAETESLRDLVS